MSEFGRIVSAPQIERGVEVCLRYFLPLYLGEVLAQAGHARDALPDPTSLTRMSEVDWPTESDVAAVIVATPGTTDVERDADDDGPAYTLTWDVRAGIVADIGEALDSREASQFYAAAAGAALSHWGVAEVAPDLRRWVRDDDGQFVTLEGSSVDLQGEEYRLMGRRPGRALIVGEARLEVKVLGARSAVPGAIELPPDPDPETPGPRDPAPSADPAPVDVSLTITRIPVEEP